MKKLTDKVMLLGIDGMDPAITRKFLAEGILPNVQKLIDAGACNEDLSMLGGVPTVTPPMWTTLATGANPATHGITDFWNQDHKRLDKMVYGLDSRICQAEQLWNVTTEAGKKTLVWHWPGSAWPPSTDSDLLYVVDGTNPVGVNMGTGQWEWEKIVIAGDKIEDANKTDHGESENGAGCIINNVDELLEAADNSKDNANDLLGDGATGGVVMSEDEGEIANLATQDPDIYRVPLKPAEKWSIDVPEGAKEFRIMYCDGKASRVALLLKNEDGVYDTVAIYKNKKADKPLFVVKNDGEMHKNFIDEMVKPDGSKAMTNRSVKINRIEEDGSGVEMYMTAALDIAGDDVFSPKSMYKEIIENVDYVQPVSLITGTDVEWVEKDVFPTWKIHAKWQSDCINYMIEERGIEVVFTHMHFVDCMGHQLLQYCNPGQDIERYNPGYDARVYQNFWRETYKITDEYIGSFLHLLDEGWTIMLISDHGLMSMENEAPVICEMAGCAIPVMREMGYVTMIKDEDGNDTREIDWSKTTAVNNRSNHIWVNLKGRDTYGIVDPKDKYELEAKIIDDLYAYRDKKTGKRIISIAMRNKDAALLGMDGPESGDIIFFLDEGFNKVHADSLSTYFGYGGTSVAPIFIGAGPGLKKNFKTKRVIREVDVTPTAAVLLGVRMPAQCEGAPVYQIIDGEV